MDRYVAFLRAINVGGHVVKMERLRALFEEIGFRNVETFIASGNVIFDADSGSPAALETRIEDHLRSALGYEVATMARTVGELVSIVEQRPFADAGAEGTRQYIVFLKRTPDEKAKAQALTYANENDHVYVLGREIHWLCRVKLTESVFAKAPLEKIVGSPVTVRNLNTVQKIAAKYS